MTEDFIPIITPAEPAAEANTPENAAAPFEHCNPVYSAHSETKIVTPENTAPPEIGQEAATSESAAEAITSTPATEPPAIQADPTPPMAPAPGWKPLGNQPYKIQVGYVRRPGYECELLLNLKLPSQEALPLVEASEKRFAEFQEHVFAMVHESRQAHAYRVAHARLEELSAKAAGLKTTITRTKADVDGAMTSGADDSQITTLLRSASEEKNLLAEIEASIPRLRAIVADLARSLHIAAIAIGREQTLALQNEVFESENNLAGLLNVAQGCFNDLLRIGTLRGLIFAPGNHAADMSARRILGTLPDIVLPADPPLPAYRPQGGPRSMFEIPAQVPVSTTETAS